MNLTEINIRLAPDRGAVKAIASCRYHDLFCRNLLIIAEQGGLRARFARTTNAGEIVNERDWLTTEAQDEFERLVLAEYRRAVEVYA